MSTQLFNYPENSHLRVTGLCKKKKKALCHLRDVPSQTESESNKKNPSWV